MGRNTDKELWKPGNMLYPVPPVLVTVSDGEGHDNVLTIAWTGTVCTNPPMVSISVREERYSFQMLTRTGEFVVNLPSRNLAEAVDYCGVRSGRDTDKFEIMKLTKQKCRHVCVPMIAESPVSIECRVREHLPLGSHHLFLADVLGVYVDQKLLDASGKLHLEKGDLLVYSHGEYYALGDRTGSFGYSVKKQVHRRVKKNNLHNQK